jgi:hypothetical protein
MPIDEFGGLKPKGNDLLFRELRVGLISISAIQIGRDT